MGKPKHLATRPPESSSNHEVLDDATVKKREDTLAILTAAGYHRGRLRNLDYFDRITGGMIWCLSKLNSVVGVDLLYQDHAHIKPKIQITEEIAKKLDAVGCPINIEPHQILILEIDALSNVIHWLLRKVLETNMNEDRNEYFVEWFEINTNTKDKASARADFIHRLKTVSEYADRRTPLHMKRWNRTQIFDSNHDARCVLAEYVKFSRDGEMLIPINRSENEAGTGNLEEASQRRNVASSNIRTMLDEAIVEVYKNETKKEKGQRERLEGIMTEYNINTHLEQLERKLSDEGCNYMSMVEERIKLTKEWERIKSSLDNTDKADQRKMAELIALFEAARVRSVDIRTATLKDVDNIKHELSLARLNRDENGQLKKYDVNLREMVFKMEEIAKERVQSAQNVVDLQCRLDKMLTTAIQAQYRKRNVELVADANSITNEMKMMVVEHNVAVDILKFSTKVKEFSQKVEESLEKQPVIQEYREAFISYINDVRAQLGEYHLKAKIAYDKIAIEKRKLAEVRSYIREKERQVNNSSDTLKDMLGLNKLLQDISADFDRIQESSPTFQARFIGDRENRAPSE